MSGESVFYADCRVGRLIEARLFTMQSLSEASLFQDQMRAAFRRAGSGALICADWRPANVMPPDVADRIAGTLRDSRALIARSAILISRERATFNLQVERVVREAQNPVRRTFREMVPMLDWLGELMSPDEAKRAVTFLAEWRLSR